MRKQNFGAKLRYRLDCLISRGPIVMTLLLFGVALVFVCVLGFLAYLLNREGGLLHQLWFSMMHALDPGTLVGDDTGNIPYLALMTVTTLCGLILTSILIGIVSSAVEKKLSDLRKGISTVQEKDHTVIIGFNDSVYTILGELIEANANCRDASVVILGEEDKETMEESLAAHVPHTRTTRVVCRSGRLYEPFFLERCAVEKSRSILINVCDDAETIKIILVLTAYLKEKKVPAERIHFVASIQSRESLAAARIAAEGYGEILYATDAISRIIAHTCRQHGLSRVLMELFDFSGDEIYFETAPRLVGKTFRETLTAFRNATVFGICREGKVKLNPPMDTLIREGDRLALLEEDDGAFVMAARAEPAWDKTVSRRKETNRDNNLLIVGSSEKLPLLLTEYDRYCLGPTRVIVVDQDLDPARVGTYKNLQVAARRCGVDRRLLEELLAEEDIDNVLLLSDDSEDAQRSDANTLVRLILLRDIADRLNRRIAITTEMRLADNQRLATSAKVDDFVIGTNIINVLMAQISQNREIMPLIGELLDEEGSELYMKPAVEYVVPGECVDFYTLTESAAAYGEIFVGYRQEKDGESVLVINPEKSGTVTLHEGDLVVVIAED